MKYVSKHPLALMNNTDLETLMKRWQVTLTLILLLAWAAPAPAQWIFGKKTKTNPTQRVPELILIVKTDPDERKRQHAAEELRDYDTAVFTEIVPILVDVLQHDKKMAVRFEALNSLTKIRPVTALAGHAIEKAAADDESWRVRLQAKTALPKYHLAGFVSKKSDPVPAATTSRRPQTQEPPLAVDTPPMIPPLPAPLPMVPPAPRPLPPNVAPPARTPTPSTQGPSLFPER